MSRPILATALVGLMLSAPLAAQSLTDARAALRSGEYSDAERGYRRALRQDPGSVEARRGLVRTLTATGSYEEAEDVAREASDAPQLANLLGQVLQRQGRLREAEEAYRLAFTGGATDDVAARANHAELLFQTGRIDEAMASFDVFIDTYNASDGRLTAEELLAVGWAVRRLGRRDPALFQDALRAYDEAATADPDWPAPRVRLGELFLEKYQGPQARTEFERALAMNPRHPEALLGMARTLDFSNEPGALERVRAALEVNPNLAPARAFLAELHLTREGTGPAREEAEAALRTNASSLPALTALAAAHYLASDLPAFREARARALAINPRYAELDAQVARHAEQTRRYAQAVERARAAVALDSASWTSWGVLGMNQIRTGAIEEGRESLERAFRGDPYNPWFKNSLDLLDTFERFRTVRTEHFELFLHGTEADLMAPLVEEMAEEAYDSLASRYGVEPPLPVRVELFPNHADFSVRTLGEAGLGALGVAFGSLVVMDSPAARDRGEYNWASTLWHELSHAFHLAMTDHRVPRWFSEGLSVHEQRRGRVGWGHQPSIPFLQALREGRLKRVSELNDGFMRPDYPQQVIFSYYQSSLVFQLIEERHGFGAIRAMLEGYRDGARTEELFEIVLGTSLEDFDEEFEAWIRARFDSALAGVANLGEVPPARAGVAALQDYVRGHPGDLVGRIRLGGLLVREERYEEARPHLEAALEIFPDYGGPDSPHWYMSRVCRAQGDLEGAAASLARLNALNESNYQALVEEADLAEAMGRPQLAVRVLERAVQVYPYDMELHLRLGGLHTALGEHDGAVRARKAVVALGPVDRAEAYYRLALAQRDAGQLDDARRSVLQALEVAPNYEEALELLLELRAGTRRP